MFSHNDTFVELNSTTSSNSNNSTDSPQWNSSSRQEYPQHYASQFPYSTLDESFLRQLVSFTVEKGKMVHASMINSSASFKNNQADNDTLNDEMCGVSHDNESAWFSTEFQATLHFMYITIFIIAIFGNGVVCFIICQSSRMQTVTNYFIANLALSDMLMAFFCIPFSFISLFVLQ